MSHHVGLSLGGLNPSSSVIMSRAASVALAIITSAMLPTSVFAQEEEYDRVMEEVVVTGSAIKREDLSNALPIQVIDQQAIQNSGVTNTMELIARVPAMQGFTTASDSVGGGGGGIRTANLRAIGDQYTLVLLNGRRMAPFGSGSFIDLSHIPLAAIERVEILTDGASALYGSDAIAGVVNFILKDSVDGTTIEARYDLPEESGGSSWFANITTGFGDINEDGYAFAFAYSHDNREALAAADRDFAKTGFILFDHPDYDSPLYYQSSSYNSIPGNAFVYRDNEIGDPIRYLTGFNPYAEQNGSCAEHTTPFYGTCDFDYASTLEILPEYSRDSIFANGKYLFSDTIQGFFTALFSRNELTARIAPDPSGEFNLPLDSPLVHDYVYPYLTPDELAETTRVTATWRALPAGNRTREFITDSSHLTVGLRGDVSQISWEVAATYSRREWEENFPTGWLLRDEFDEFITRASAGLFNVFAPIEEFTEQDMKALAPAIYHGNWSNNGTAMGTIDGKMSMPMWDMGGGSSYLAMGVDARNQKYEHTVAEANLNEELLSLGPDIPYDMKRKQWGVFTEFLFPFADAFELTASLRYDSIGGVNDALAGEKINESDSDVTYKFSGLWTIAEWIAARGSYGTGFKAPSMREIGAPRSDDGVTSVYACPFDVNDPLATYCLPGDAQYSRFAQGSATLQSETSTQYTAGLILTPSDHFDMTIDYWNIELNDLVERLTSDQVFADPVSYRSLFTTKTNLGTGFEELAIILAWVNAGWKKQSGIDYTLHSAIPFSWGSLDLGLVGTHTLESESSLTGSSLGRFGNDHDVVFKNIWNFSATLYTGAWQNHINFNYRSGYLDDDQTVEITGTGKPLGEGPTTDIQLDIGSYTLLDYQLRYNGLSDRLALMFGVNNLLDEVPPLSLRGGGTGHQVGWDPRYTDAYCRTYYVQASYTFGK